MELIAYIDCVVKINTSYEYYYTGKVLSADNNSLTLLDKKNCRVTLRANDIRDITEVKIQ